MAGMPETNELTVDFCILADRAEVANNKLFVMGGAWDTVYIQDFIQPHPLSFALGVLIPWNATNQQHTVTITIEDADGKPLEFRVDLAFVTGRPAQSTPGETQRTTLAVPLFPTLFPQEGRYELRVDLNGRLAKRVPFKVVRVQLKIPSMLPLSRG